MKARDDINIKILIGLDTDIHLGRVVEVASPNADTCTQNELVGRFYALSYAQHYRMKSWILRILRTGFVLLAPIREWSVANTKTLIQIMLNSIYSVLMRQDKRWLISFQADLLLAQAT